MISPRFAKGAAFIFVGIIMGAGSALAQAPTPSPPPTPTAPAADVAAVKILVAGKQPAWIHGEPVNSRVGLLVENVGDAPAGPYTIAYQWVSQGSVTPLNEDEKSSFDAREEPLEPGETAVHEAPWRLQPHQKGSGMLRAVIEPGPGDASSANNLVEAPQFVPDHHVVVDVLGEPQDLRPHDTRFLRIAIENRGNDVEFVALSVANSSVGDAGRLDEVIEDPIVSVSASQASSTNLYVTYPFIGDTNPFNVSYEVVAETVYGRTLQVMAPEFVSIDAPLPAPSPFSFMREGSSSLGVVPGGSVTVGFRLTNHGPASETYNVRAIVGDAWSAGVSRERAALLAGESVSFSVAASAPLDAVRGSSVPLRVEVKPDRAAEPSPVELVLRVVGPTVRLEALAKPSSSYVGEVARLGLRIVNGGEEATSAEDRLRVRATGLGSDEVVVEEDVPSVLPGASAQVEVVFPSYAQGGLVQFDAEWVPSDTDIAWEGVFVEEFVRDANILVVAPPPLTGAPGEIVAYRTAPFVFRVVNDGNSDEAFHLSVTADHGQASLAVSDQTVVVARGESRLVAVDHRLPLPAGRLASDNVTLRVALASRPDTAWSGNASTGIFDAQPPTLSLAAPLPPLWAFGEPLVLEVVVTDDGEVDRVQFAHAPPSGGRVESPMVPVGASVWRTNVTLEESGAHGFEFKAWDAVGRSATLDAGLVEVRRISPPRASVTGPDVASAHSNVTFLVEVEGERPVASVRVRVVGADGSAVVDRVLPVQDSRAVFDLSDVPPGLWVVEFVVTDDAGARTTVSRPLTAVAPPVPRMEPQESDDDAAPGGPAPGVGLAVVMVAVALAVGRLRRASGVCF